MFFLVCTFVWVWLCICLWFYSLLKAPPFPKYIFIIHQKPIFPFFLLACILFQLFVLPVLLREVNPTDETDPFVVFMVCSGLFKLLILMNMEFPGGNKPFNWLIPFCFVYLVWKRIVSIDVCRNNSKKGSLKNWLKNFDTCELLFCSALFDCRPNLR